MQFDHLGLVTPKDQSDMVETKRANTQRRRERPNHAFVTLVVVMVARMIMAIVFFKFSSNH